MADASNWREGDHSENRKKHPRHSDWREQEDHDHSENHRPGNFGDDRSNRLRFAVAHHPIIPLPDDGGNTPASSLSRPHATVDAIAGMSDRPPIFADRSRFAAPVDSPLMLLPETFRVDQSGALRRAILQARPHRRAYATPLASSPARRAQPLTIPPAADTVTNCLTPSQRRGGLWGRPTPSDHSYSRRCPAPG